MAYRLILLILLYLGAATAVADEIEKNKGVLKAFHNGGLMFEQGLQFNYQVSFRIWAMLNEPVYNVKFLWSFDERARVDLAMSNSLFDPGDRPLSRLISELETEERDSINPYEVKVRIEGHKLSDPMSRYYVIWDVGVPGPSGSTSYNTPASPRWDEMFMTFSRSVGEAEAKALMKDGFIADSVSIVSIKWHLDDYYRAMNKRYPPGKKAALRRAAEKHITLLAELQGLPRWQLEERLSKVLNEVEEKRQKGDPNFMQSLDSMVAKFEAGLPPEMRNMNVEARYREALQEIKAEKEEDLNQPQKLTFNFGLTYADWVKDKRAEIGARKQYATEMVSFTDENIGKCGFKDEDGSIVIPAKYYYCFAKKGGFGVVNKVNGYELNGWGVINSFGDEVIPTENWNVQVEDDKSDDPVFVVAKSVDYEGSCGSRRRISQLQRMDSRGESLGSSYREDVSSPGFCFTPITLTVKSLDD